MNSPAIDPIKDYPAWMRKAMQPFDWGLFLSFALGMIAGMHFIISAGMVPASTIEHMMFRAQDTAEAIAEGRLYPRWAPDALGGYGAPIPVFSPPAPSYLAGTITYFFTGDPVGATRGLFALVLGAAASTMYLLTRRLLDAHAALLAAALYVFNPMISLDTAIIRGDLHLLMSVAMMPAWLWSIARTEQTFKPLNLLLMSLIGAGLILTDPAFALVAGGVGAVYLIWSMLRHQVNKRPWLVGIAATASIALSSFFWLPAWVESSVVRWLPPFGTYQLDAINWLAPIRAIDPFVANPIPQYAPGWTLLTFAILGLATTFLKWPQQSTLRLLAGSLPVLWFASTLSGSTTLHKMIVLASAIVFAGLGGSILVWRVNLPEKWRRLPLPTLLILIWVGSIPVWLPPSSANTLPVIDDKAQANYEVQGFGVAGLAPDQAAPVTIAPDLPANVGLLEGYQSGTVNKFVPSQFTTDIQAALLDHNSHSDRFQLRATTPTTLSILTACFPGWEAWANGTPLVVTCNPETGLIELKLTEATGGELVIQMGTTPVRAAAWAITALSLFGLVIYSLRRSRGWDDPFEDISLLPLADARLLALALAAIGGLTYWLHQANPPLNLRPEPGFELRAASPAGFRSDTGITLLGFTQSESRAHPGEAVNVTLYWSTGRDLNSNYQIQITLIETNTRAVWILSPFRHPGGYPARRWLTGITVLDNYQLALPETLKAGNYQLGVEANDCNPDCESGHSVRFFNVDGRELGDYFRLPTRLVLE